MEKHQEIRLSFEAGCEETVSVTPLGDNLYRLDLPPFFVEMDLSVGDIIEVETQANGALHFCRIVARSGWRQWSWILRKDTFESAPFLAFQQAIKAQNGVWERVLGGVFVVYLPPDADFDPDTALKQAIAQQELENKKPEA
jgi:hypothetical protein